MKGLKEQKGITLVALIITIIVMLILVGVTINVAVNGGLMGKAREARDKTQVQADKEQLMSIALGTIDEATFLVNGEKLEDELEEMEWGVEEITEEVEEQEVLVGYKCESPNRNLFMVAPKGTIEILDAEE